MKKSTTLVILAVSALFAAFAFGTLCIRPAEAQSPHPSMNFPRQADLWRYSIDPSHHGIFQPASQDPFNPLPSEPFGWFFQVNYDNFGRLPVLTEWVWWEQNPTLFKRGGDGLYRKIAGFYGGIKDTYNPGFVLAPGDYVFYIRDSSNVEIWRGRVALIGFWANP